MPRVTWIECGGSRRTVQTAAGATLMATAVRHDIAGIEAHCGGALCCATCHVYVDPDWWCQLPVAEADEIGMLAFVAAARRPTSRLSCQIIVTASLDGLTVAIPDRQV